MPPAERRRILLVTNRFGWGGAEKQLEHLAAGLAGNGHSVVVVAIGDRVLEMSWLEAAGAKLVTLGARGKAGKLRALPTLRRHAREAEIVHCTGWDASLWGRLAAIGARRPTVITEHTPGRSSQAVEGLSGVRTIAAHNRLLAPFTYATIAVGAWQRQLIESEGVSGEAIVHIPNGVPVAELRERGKAGAEGSAWSLPQEALVLNQVARFAAQKGHAVTLRTVAHLRERLGDVRVVMPGGGEEEERIRREAAEIGADWAVFPGFMEDVAGLLALSDLTVLPSEAEGLPMSLLESLAVGTPIVATDVGDVGWFLRTTGAGVCVPAGDEDAFRRACAEVLEDRELHGRLAAAAESSAAEFDSARMVRRYEEVFEAAIAGAPQPIELSE
jgi:glycosyltransferase involved in cell wall biosynthesis